MVRFFAFLVLLGLIGGGLYYWKFQPERGPAEDIGAVAQGVRDTATTGAVRTAFSLHSGLRRYPIQVETEDGVVTLRGAVGDEGSKAEAHAVASAVPDVRQVVNHIRVSHGLGEATGSQPEGRTLGESLDDEALEMKVRLAFSLRRELAGTGIEVAAYRKRVTLSGAVKTAAQRDLAVSVARQTDGVRDVTDSLRVEDGTSYSKAGAAEKALAANPNLARYALTAREEGGRIVLAGRVRTGAERDLAALLAREAAGGPVDNRIEVRP